MGEWKEVKLDNILEKITKGTTPPKGSGFVDKGINYIKSDAIGYDGRIDKKSLYKLTLKHMKNLRGLNLKKMIFYFQWRVLT